MNKTEDCRDYNRFSLAIICRMPALYELPWSLITSHGFWDQIAEYFTHE